MRAPGAGVKAERRRRRSATRRRGRGHPVAAPSQSLQWPGQSPQVPLTVAAAPPGSPHSRCRSQVKATRCPSQSLQLPGAPHSRCSPPGAPYSRCSLPGAPHSWARFPTGPVGPVVVPVLFGLLSYQPRWIRCRDGPVGSVVVPVPVGSVVVPVLFGQNVLPKCSA